MDLELLQHQHRHWVGENFPEIVKDKGKLARHGLYGLVEEVGELSHGFLKQEQGIRGFHDHDFFRTHVADCIGDIVIFADTVCFGVGLDFPSVVKETWKDVRRRNWMIFPKNGLTE